MRIFVGFDDTDSLESDYGTGKVVRWFKDEMPDGCRLWGVVRQQLLVDERIPYTSHNSSACAVIDAPDPSFLKLIISSAMTHIEKHAVAGSDPGVCVSHEEDSNLANIIAFGQQCTREVVNKDDARRSASRIHLSGHGGTHDGIIGAAAAVGLTAYGWSGRFIEYGELRAFSGEVTVAEMERHGIAVVSVDRQAPLPSPGDTIHTGGWLRPRLWGNRPVLPVSLGEKNEWICLGRKGKKEE